MLQPQSEIRRLREWLCDRGYLLEDERMVRDRGRDYVALAARTDRPAAESLLRSPRRELLLEAGPVLIGSADRLVRDHWLREAARLDRVVSRSRGAAPREARERLDRVTRILELLPQPDGSG